MNKNNGKSENKKFEYAWEWFKYHAEQRLVAFHYFLVLFGLVSLGYGHVVSSALQVRLSNGHQEGVNLFFSWN